MIGHPRPAFGFAKQLPNLCKRQLTEQPQRKYLFIGFGQRMLRLVDSKRCLRAQQFVLQILDAILSRFGAPVFAQPGVIFVFGNLAQPNIQAALATEAADCLQCLEKRLLPDLFGYVLVPAQR